MSTLDELCQEVLELDEKATKGPLKAIWNEKVNRWEVYRGIEAVARIAQRSVPEPEFELGKAQADAKSYAHYRTSAPLLAKACEKMKEALIKIGIKSHDEFMQTNGIIEHEQILFRRGQTAREALADVDALLKGEK